MLSSKFVVLKTILGFSTFVVAEIFWVKKWKILAFSQNPIFHDQIFFFQKTFLVVKNRILGKGQNFWPKIFQQQQMLKTLNFFSELWRQCNRKPMRNFQNHFFFFETWKKEVFFRMKKFSRCLWCEQKKITQNDRFFKRVKNTPKRRLIFHQNCQKKKIEKTPFMQQIGQYKNNSCLGILLLLEIQLNLLKALQFPLGLHLLNILTWLTNPYMPKIEHLQS